MINKPSPLGTVFRCPNPKCKHEFNRRNIYTADTQVQCAKCKRVFTAYEYEIFTLKWVKQA